MTVGAAEAPPAEVAELAGVALAGELLSEELLSEEPLPEEPLLEAELLGDALPAAVAATAVLGMPPLCSAQVMVAESGAVMEPDESDRGFDPAAGRLFGP